MLLMQGQSGPVAVPNAATFAWIEAVPVPMIVTRTVDRAVLAANRHAQELFGYTPTQWSRLTIDALARPDFRPEVHAQVSEAETGHRAVVQWIKEYVRADGTTFLGQLSASALPDHPGIGCAVITDVDEATHLTSATLQAATSDPLTGVLRRDAFATAVEAKRRPGRPYGLIFIDLDDFKLVNDWHGHLAGDQVLRIMSRRIMHAIRADDCAARYGGDEFVVFIPTVSTEPRLRELAARLQAHLEEPIDIGTASITVSASVGAVVLDPDTGLDVAIETADRAMYVAKRGDRLRRKRRLFRLRGRGSNPRRVG